MEVLSFFQISITVLNAVSEGSDQLDSQATNKLHNLDIWVII